MDYHEAFYIEEFLKKLEGRRGLGNVFYFFEKK